MMPKNVIRLVTGKSQGDSPLLLKAFAERFFKKTPAASLNLFGEEELADFILNRFQAFQRIAGTDSSLEITPNSNGSSVFGSNTIIDVAIGNCPFIIETILSFLSFHKLTLVLNSHFILTLPTKEGEREWSYSFYVLEPLKENEIAATRRNLKESLLAIGFVTGDFRRINELADEAATLLGEGNKDDEAVNFLRWLKGNNFIYFGAARFERSGDELREANGSAAGLLRKEAGLQARILPYAIDWNDEAGIRVTVTNVTSPVHKFEDIILIQTKLPNDEEFLLIGHFTSAAKRLELSSVPIIRRKVGAILKEAGYLVNTYDYKNEYLLLHRFPFEELFSLSSVTIRRVISFLKQVPAREDFNFLLDSNDLPKLLIGTILLPAEMFTVKLFRQIKEVFAEELPERHVRSYSFPIDDERVVLHFLCNDGGNLAVNKDRLMKRVETLCKTWEADVFDQILTITGEEHSMGGLQGYFSNLPAGYKSSVSREFAAVDFLYVHRFKEETPKVEAFIKREDGERFALRLYSNHDITLSGIMPVLNSFGFNVRSSEHFSVVPDDSPFTVRIQAFEVLFSEKLHKEFGEIREGLLQSLVAALRHETSVDPLNRLTLKIGLSCREVNLLRTYRNLLLQYTGTLKADSINNALILYEGITEALLDFFKEKFSPGRIFASQDEWNESLEARKERLKTMLLEVTGIQDDRIIRSILTLIDASLRTNYFIKERKMFATTISIKLDSRKIPFAVEPKPFREIFVYDVDMEGIHLRGGRIARGGIRWSDRSDDFRTEVLGLMKTQMVKNTVIVPVGSKGGFVVKRTEANRNKNLRELGISCYEKFMSGLLDITDSYAPDNSEARPAETVIHDDFDPYLVVAADKGTAAFSDIANRISLHYDFWLKDAFASGGSNGYNHKAMGITARGAWECAKRHFREMGIDIQTQEIKVIGIGDMSGDVFGNGMLLSRKIRLVAAFDHRHVFIDPNPENTEASFEERKRLFNLERSAWSDYSPSLISKGGGVFKRDAKAITLSPETKELLGTTKDEVNGEELVALVLKAPADMIFNGGIGTYVKASTETHAEVDDKSNDAVRVNAADIKAKVIVEGGNLGVTQKARIEFEKQGGILNTDAIDNSAGVDTSDHEVNLKILIESLKSKGKIKTEEEGRQALADCQEYVAERVLRHNFYQSAAISMDRIRFRNNSGSFLGLLKTLEAESLLNRGEDDIPDDGELEYLIQQRGVPRSVLSYVMGLEKIRLYNLVSDAEISRKPSFRKFLFEYFPSRFHESAREEILNHRLSNNIVATILVNRVVNRGGIAFVHSLAQDTLASEEDVLETYYFVDEILDAETFRRRVMKLAETIPSDTLYHLLISYERVISKMVKWILQQGKADFVNFANVGMYKEKIGNYFKEYFLFLSEITPESYQHVFDEIGHLKENNVPEDIAREAAYAIFLKPALGLIRISEQTGVSIRMVAESNIIIGERFHLNYLQSLLRKTPLKTEWEKACHNTLESGLYSSLDKLVCDVLGTASDEGGIGKGEQLLSRIYRSLGMEEPGKDEASDGKSNEMRQVIVGKLEAFIKERSVHVAELDEMVGRLKATPSNSLTPLVVLEKFVAKLVRT